MEKRMKESFNRLASWLERNSCTSGPMFNPPASDAQVARAETLLGRELPSVVRELYRLADGQPAGAVALEGSFTLLSLDDVVDSAGFLNGEFPDELNVHDPDHAPMDVDVGIRATWWSRGWVPVMRNGGGDYLCIDLDPAVGGTSGQVVTYYHDESFRRLVAPGIDALFARRADGVASGRFRVTERMIEEV